MEEVAHHQDNASPPFSLLPSSSPCPSSPHLDTSPGGRVDGREEPAVDGVGGGEVAHVCEVEVREEGMASVEGQAQAGQLGLWGSTAVHNSSTH